MWVWVWVCVGVRVCECMRIENIYTNLPTRSNTYTYAHSLAPSHTRIYNIYMYMYLLFFYSTHLT